MKHDRDTVQSTRCILLKAFCLGTLATYLEAQTLELTSVTPPLQIGSGTFGGSLALDHDRLLLADPGAFSLGGEVLSEYRRTSSGWEFVAAVQNPTEVAGSTRIGFRMVAGDDWVVLTGVGHGFTGFGALYIANRQPSGQWQFTQRIDCPAQFGPSGFGGAAVASGTTMFVAAPQLPINGQFLVGKVFVFERHGTHWGWTNTIEPPQSDQVPGLRFGSSLAFDGETLLVATDKDPLHFPGGSAPGQVIVYEQDIHGQWSPTGRLADNAPHSSGHFGASLAFDKNRAIVGKPYSSHFPLRSGEVLVFERLSSTTWTQLSTLRPSDGFADQDGGDRFGTSLAVEANTLAVGAKRGMGTGNKEGAVYIFHRDSTGQWPTQESVRCVMSDGVGGGFGANVALSGGLLAASAAYRPVFDEAVFLHSATEKVDVCVPVPGVANVACHLGVLGGASSGGGVRHLTLSACQPGARFVIAAAYAGGPGSSPVQIGGMPLCLQGSPTRVAFGQVSFNSTVHLVNTNALPIEARRIIGAPGALYLQALVAGPGGLPNTGLTNALRVEVW